MCDTHTKQYIVFLPFSSAVNHLTAPSLPPTSDRRTIEAHISTHSFLTVHCTIYHTALYCTVQHNTLHCIVLYYTPHCTVLYSTTYHTAHCTVLNCCILSCTLDSSTWYTHHSKQFSLDTTATKLIHFILYFVKCTFTIHIAHYRVSTVQYTVLYSVVFSVHHHL